MFLAVDIGNTNINFGVFNNNEIIKTFKTPTHNNDIKEVILENTQGLTISKCGIITVVEKKETPVKTIIDNLFNINSKIINPDPNAGTDRLANIAGARTFCTTKPIIIVDSGTATTFDIADKEGVFIGGIIMPGLNMQLDSLHNKTSKLPKIEINNIDNVIGNNTQDSILAGVIRASACAIDGLIDECEQELGEKTFLIGTGGGMKTLIKYIKHPFDILDSNITLKGIKVLFDKQ